MATYEGDVLFDYEDDKEFLKYLQRMQNHFEVEENETQIYYANERWKVATGVGVTLGIVLIAVVILAVFIINRNRSRRRFLLTEGIGNPIYSMDTEQSKDFDMKDVHNKNTIRLLENDTGATAVVNPLYQDMNTTESES